MKRQIIGISLFILIMGSYFIYEQSKKTTYEKVIGELIEQGENVESITVSNRVLFLNQSIRTTIEDKESIDEILAMGKTIKLKKTSDKHPPVSTFLTIQTNEHSYRIGMEANFIEVNGQRYFTTPMINPIYMYFVTEKLDWEFGHLE